MTAPSKRAAVDPALLLNWSALKDFLVVAQCGTLSAAARQLGVSQPTLTRRMSGLEESLGAELFNRGPRGLELTPTGEALLGPARQMEAGAQAVELIARGRDTSLSGLVRLTATEGLGVDWLPPELIAFRARHPRIDVEVIVRNTALNLLRREADIAIRLGRPRDQMDLLARRVGEPSSPEDLARHTAVSFNEADLYTGAGRWIEQTIGDARVVYRASTLSAQRSAIRAGFGIGTQSCFIAKADPQLARVLPEITLQLEIWLVTHSGLRRTARIRALYDFVAERLIASAPRLSGRTD